MIRLLVAAALTLGFAVLVAATVATHGVALMFASAGVVVWIAWMAAGTILDARRPGDDD